MANLRANKIVGIGSTDAGVTFDGFNKFKHTRIYVFPNGNTTDRGRGRGFYMLGYNGTPSANYCN